MAVATYTEIFLKRVKKKQVDTRRQSCSICGKEVKFHRTTDDPLACWQCMIVNE